MYLIIPVDRNDAVAIFIDITKAFDKVFSSSQTLSCASIESPIARSITIQKRPSRHVVPQDSTLSPLLYALYTSDIPRISKVELAMYDAVLYTTDRSAQILAERLQLAAESQVIASVSDGLRLTRRRAQRYFLRVNVTTTIIKPSLLFIYKTNRSPGKTRSNIQVLSQIRVSHSDLTLIKHVRNKAIFITGFIRLNANGVKCHFVTS